MSAFANILKSVGARKLYTDEITKPTIAYRAVAGRLNDFDGKSAEQRFAARLGKKSGDTLLEQRNAVIETGLAALMQRADTVGPFHQYPRVFFVGPSQFKKAGGIKSGTITKEEGLKPKYRDVDKIIWIRAEDDRGDAYRLTWSELFHDDFVPGELKMRTVTVLYHSDGARTPVPKLDLPALFFLGASDVQTLFSQNERYKKAEIIPLTREDVKTEEPHLALLWFAQLLSSNRYPVARKAIAVDEREQMLASVLIARVPFFKPKVAEQKNRPVPIGHMNAARMVTVLNVIFLGRGSVAASSASPMPRLYDWYGLSDDEL